MATPGDRGGFTDPHSLPPVPESGTHYVHVVLPLPMDTSFTYSVGETPVEAGTRVVVPFGARTLTGVVVGADARPADPLKVKQVSQILDDEPSLSDDLLELTRWVSEYYMCSWGEAARAALPPGIDVSSSLRVRAADDPPDSDDAVERAVLDHLVGREDASVVALSRAVDGCTPAAIRRMERKGLVQVFASVSSPRVRTATERIIGLVEPNAQAPGAKQRAVLEFLAGKGDLAVSAVLEATGASSATLRSLERRGVVSLGEREVSRTPDAEALYDRPVSPVDFHAHQRAAADRISEAVDGAEFRTFLLHGVTGSGKTEVYIAALGRTLDTGRGGIVLVPEIALTPQTVRRFRARFGDRIAVLHSRLSDGERYDAWRAIRRGDFDVVIGPRSAVFAPVRNLGLVIVDEEHESSYKQFDPAPRYHARDVAVVRASREGAVCVLGSATPSLESLYNARSGKYELLTMPERVTPPGHEPARLPKVRIVDLAAERRSGRRDGAVSAPLQAAIRRRLDDGHQVILLQNRRGFAPVLECADCGWSPACPDCAVTLTYHKSKRQLRCHYCGRAFRYDGLCGNCGGDSLENLGAGTQRVEEDLVGLFPDARILRMDLDTTSGRNAHDRILSAFGRGEADILLGTQMVAKGLDFERVTLVGVIDADAGLLLPDLRSDERIFQLLTQVAGRAGRAELRGEVLLQTRNPDHPVIRLAKRHDYDGFAETVLPARHALGYPPFTRLVRVDFRGPDERDVAEFADRWKRAFDANGHAIECIGPAAAFVPRVRKTWRMHVLLKAARSVPASVLRDTVRETTDRAGRPPARTRIAIDVDPTDLL